MLILKHKRKGFQVKVKNIVQKLIVCLFLGVFTISNVISYHPFENLSKNFVKSVQYKHKSSELDIGKSD
ncbi:PhrA family quorum-sensing system peptide [Streptococcus iniae]